MALSHTNIIFTAIMSRIILKEKLGIQHLIAIFLTLSGVILITKPSFMFENEFLQNQTLSNLTFNQIEMNENNYDRIVGVTFAMIGAFGSGAMFYLTLACNMQMQLK